MVVVTRPDAPERTTAPAAASCSSSPAKGLRRRRLVRGVLLTVGGYLLVSIVLLAWSALDARRGLTELRTIRATVTAGDLLDGSAADRLSGAQADFDRAAGRVDGPWFAPLRLVPVVGRQVTSFESVVSGAAEVTALAGRGVDDAQAAVGDTVPTGPGRVDALRALAAVAERTAASVGAVDAGPSGWLAPILSGARAGFADEKDELEETLLRSRDASTALATVLDGPSTYLLFAANNAEMRSGSGMLLSAGLLTAADGRLEVTDLEATEELLLAEGVGVEDEDIADQWGFTGPDRDFRNLLLSPRFGPNAEMASRMWSALGRPPVDGVIALDVFALEDLLEAVGPVDVSGNRIDHTNVRRLLLHDQYLGVAPDDTGQAARRDQMGQVAQAVLERFDSSRPEPGALARGLRDAAAGRHLMLWSADEALEQAWRGVNVAGDVTPGGVLVSVLNDGNNKLDQFLEIDAELIPGEGGEGTLRMAVTNSVGLGEPGYISGADPESVGGYGVYPGFLTVAFPAGTDLSVSQGPAASVGGPDGGSEMLAAPVRIPPGETVEWSVTYALGQDLDTLTLLPSARSPGIDWVVGDRSWNDTRRPSRTIELP